MSAVDQYNYWLQNDQLLLELKEELKEISNNLDEIHDRFYRDLQFGTGGLRGVIGAGTNRMNIHTVARTSQGFSNYLKTKFNAPSICIAYDTRNKSKEFAETAVRVFCANGIKTYLFNSERPTPMLSFAVRHLRASAGIVITASHNPKQYNGYKVYNSHGGQITDGHASEIFKHITNCHIFNDIKIITIENALKTRMLELIGDNIDTVYYEKVKSLAMRTELLKNKADQLKILYTPLHGAGNIPIRTMLVMLGFSNFKIVTEQELPDGNFPTVSYPNPEDPSVFDIATKMAETWNPDLIFATDPDCDRIGVLIKDKSGEYSVLTGNQTGALLCDYIIKTMKELHTMPSSPAVIKTIVTTDITNKICKKNDIDVFDVLTGFKYIGELAESWHENNQNMFIFGFEESYGFLAGDFVRDKDAVIAAVLISEMVLYYKNIGITLFEALEELYKEYGYYKEKLISIDFHGEEGQKKCLDIIDNLRSKYLSIFKEYDLEFVEDYKNSVKIKISENTTSSLRLPESNVIKFIFKDESWIVFRPSGTEPKIKIYISAVSDENKKAKKRLIQLEDLASTVLN